MSEVPLVPSIACPVCLDLYESQGAHQPMLFVCSHGACKQCVEKMELKEGVKCPVCSKELTGDPITNVALAESVQDVMPCTDDVDVPCGGKKCAKRLQPSNADVYCPVCDRCFCLACAEMHNAVLEHETLPVAQRPAASVKCVVHDEKLNYFCETCMKPVCHACTLVAQHKGHTVGLVGDSAAVHRADLKEVMGEMNSG